MYWNLSVVGVDQKNMSSVKKRSSAAAKKPASGKAKTAVVAPPPPSTDKNSLEVKEMRRRKSSVAFQVMLAPESKSHCNPTIPKSPCSKRDKLCIAALQKKQEEAENRRKAHQEAMLNSLRADDEKIAKAQLKKAELQKQTEAT